jgi:hypothetical protein
MNTKRRSSSEHQHVRTIQSTRHPHFPRCNSSGLLPSTHCCPFYAEAFSTATAHSSSIAPPRYYGRSTGTGSERTATSADECIGRVALANEPWAGPCGRCSNQVEPRLQTRSIRRQLCEHCIAVELTNGRTDDGRRSSKDVCRRVQQLLS